MTLYFFPDLFFIIFLIFAHLWWFGVLGLGSQIGFLGLELSVDGVWDCHVGLSGFFGLGLSI